MTTMVALRPAPARLREREIHADDCRDDVAGQLADASVELRGLDRADARVERRHDDQHRRTLTLVQQLIEVDGREIAGGQGKLGGGIAGAELRAGERHGRSFESNHSYVNTSSSRSVSRAMTTSIAIRSPTETSRPQR